jgi:PEP-CTERM motif
MNKKIAFVVSLAALGLLSALPAIAGAVGGNGNTVPEPATLTLLASGIGAVAILRHSRKK